LRKGARRCGSVWQHRGLDNALALGDDQTADYRIKEKPTFLWLKLLKQTAHRRAQGRTSDLLVCHTEASLTTQARQKLPEFIDTGHYTAWRLHCQRTSLNNASS
jgi:hypothetical protein